MDKHWATRAVGSLVTALTVLLQVPGVAQAKPGDHLGTETTEVIPAIEFKGVRRSNVYLAEGGAGAQEVGGTSIRIHPSLNVDSKGETAVFGLDLDYTAIKYLESSLTNLDRYKNMEFGSNLNLLPNAPVGLKLNELFMISGRETEATYATSAYINHTTNSTSGRISVHPGSALEVDLGGSFTYDKYDVAPATTADGNPALNNRTGYGPGVDLKWKFFPKTAILASYSMAWFTWDQNLLDARGDGISREDVGASLGVPDGQVWRSSVGIRGRFTDKIVLGLVAGYGQMIYDENSVIEESGGGAEANAAQQGFDEDLKGLPEGMIAVVEIRYHPAEKQTLTIGYRKAFQDVYFTNFVDFHNAFMRYEGTFVDKFGARAEVGYRYEQYVGEVSRDDHVIRLALDMSYRTTEWMDVGAGVAWRQRGSADSLHPEIEYDDLAVSLGLTFTY